ncbi:MAG: Rha family transcriptional regulator [Aeromonadaceae bacterium]
MHSIDLFRQLVTAQGDQITTTSRKVADLFGKRHADVLRRISKLDCSDYFNQRNFALVEYVDEKGEKRPEFEITRDGTAFLIMGFTGSKAGEFKEAYINAFNWMADMLRQRAEIDFMMGDFSRRESASISSGSFHGRGLARRRQEKYALASELEVIEQKLQMVLPLIKQEGDK